MRPLLVLVPADALPTLLKALDDACEYRRDGIGEDCNDCSHQDGLCGDHASDQETARAYDALFETLRRDRGAPNGGFFGGLWAYLAPAGWATQWYWPDGVRGRVWNLLHGRGWRVR